MAIAGPAHADTLPSQLADMVGADPKANTADCVAAKADAYEWSEEKGKNALRTIGRIAIWPLGERAARRRGRARNEARELVMQRLREACFTQPELVRASAVAGQRRPGGRGYEGDAVFRTGAGGRNVVGVVHPVHNTIWLRPGGGEPGFATWQPDDWARSAAWVIAPSGCQVAEDWAAPGNTREVSFVCPSGVDLRALLLSQSERVRAGAPLLPEVAAPP
ncbi:hypothetical protein [Caulobacter sp. NIBR1757]|uniref:hypothetical protein n=1 Tax=Caulobacter sp. NIBR1757 TaxID=3016000 RepID=UPI0022F0D573|nr:hypothetical protein [Caulobacter sp. NIBR1757]